MNAKRTTESQARRTAAGAAAAQTGIRSALASLLRAKGSGALAACLATAALACALVLPASASADFGLNAFDVTFTGPNGETVTQAGSHPFATNISLHVKSTPFGEGEVVDEAAKDIILSQIAGFVGNPTAAPPCSTAAFLTAVEVKGHPEEPKVSDCPNAAAVGTVSATVANKGGVTPLFGALYNLAPPPGVAAKLGFWGSGVPITFELGVEESPPYKIIGGATNVSQVLEVVGSDITLWGTPADPRHDPLRGFCFSPEEGVSLGECEANIPEVPFLTLPRACAGPLKTTYKVDSWQNPGVFVEGFAETHDSAGNPAGFSGCGKLGFEPEISAVPTSKAATSPSGLDFSLDTENEGLANPEGISNADVEKAVVTLPEGFSTNPALAEGLATCSEGQFEAETPYSASGEGPNFAPPGVACPEASKIGSVEVETPVLEDKVLHGAIYIATPYQNPFNSLIAIYMVIKDPTLGIVVKVPLQVEPDPVTGQLTTVADNLPPFPFSHFKLHFREGTRSPLVTPSACGTYDGAETSPGVFNPDPVKALLYPSSGGAPVQASSSFEIISGPDGGPCPSGGLPPFHPELLAGTENNAAGAFSPFLVKLTRTDSEQEFTHFSIKLPPGVAGKLAGIPFCSDAAIAAATARTGPHGGSEELNSPSCPAASYVGRTLAGAGVGPSLAYAPGKVYLAGPYHGKPLSMVAITAGVVGPFDIGTVVVRLAIDVNPETGEVFLDSSGSDPLPHIVKGIPVHLRDVRAYTDRPEFTFNPTSCEPTSTAATVLGSGLDFVSPADDNPFVSTSPFQAADCASLAFKPKLYLKLKGATKRGGNPALRATLIPRAGDANSKSISVALPHSEFLDQAHIRTVCTRVQFNAGAGNGAACPAGSVYGHARAWTPLLSEPLEGPIFLRSSEHPLPDLVVAVHGLIDFNAVGRIDSVKGGIRNTFDFVPDAPISKVVVNFQGGKKGLLENSTNLCKSKNRAKVKFKGHNGKTHNTNPVLQVKCKKHKKKHKQGKAHKRSARAAR